MTTEAQRRAILADIIDPIWGSAPDHEIADAHGVTPRAVRDLRAEHRRSLGIAALAPRLEELAALTAWPGTPGELLAACVDAALMRAQAREHREGYGSPMARHRAVLEAQRGAAMETAFHVDGGLPAVPQTGAPGSGAVRAAVDRITPEPADTSSSPVSGNEKSVPTATPKPQGSSPGLASAAVLGLGRGHSGGSCRPPPDGTALLARLLAP